MSLNKSMSESHAPGRRCIIATNRNPLEQYTDYNGQLHYRQSAGGVVTNLLEASHEMAMTWFTVMPETQQPQSIPTAVLPSPLQLRQVRVPQDVYERYYDKMSNQVLWFLQHYLYENTNALHHQAWLNDAWYAGYCRVNALMAEAIAAEVESRAARVVVMLHDYHFYLTPALIRQRTLLAIIQQFLHIPWPEVRYWQLLPHAILEGIFHGLLGNDIIGFHTEHDAYNFVEGVRYLIKDADIVRAEGVIRWQGRTIRVRTYPGSIAPEAVRQILHSEEGRRATENIKPYLGKRTILRVDRIEPTKNILLGFEAYALMLKEHPELHREVTFLACLVPSRERVPRYQEYKTRIFAVVEAINRDYQCDDWKPIQILYENDRVRAIAAMQLCDVLLVNPLIDGMNMVAKEGVIATINDSVLLLSRTAGAFNELRDVCLPLSPLDVHATAHALYQALTLPPQQRRLMANAAKAIVEKHDLHAWLHQQWSDIDTLL